MIAAELRGGSKPSLNEALGWIGSRVDDIYGASVGRLEDVWIDPGTGVPRWLLVKEGRFGGRTTLIPFEDATAGAGHVWVPYEREVVRDAPEIEPGAPLTQHVEGALRAHYSANAPSAISQGAEAATRPAGTELRPDRPAPQPEATPPQPGSALGTATIRFHTPPVAGPPEYFASGAAQADPQGAAAQADPPPGRRAATPPSGSPAPHHAAPAPQRPVIRGPESAPVQPFGAAPAPRLPDRPPPPVAAPAHRAYQPTRPRESAPAPAQPYGYQPPADPYGYQPPAQPYGYQPPAQPSDYRPPAYSPPAQRPSGYQPPAQPAHREQTRGDRRTAPTPEWAQPVHQQPPTAAADPAQGPVDQLRALADAGGTHYVEIELSGELTIRGELRSVKVTPRQGP